MRKILLSIVCISQIFSPLHAMVDDDYAGGLEGEPGPSMFLQSSGGNQGQIDNSGMLGTGQMGENSHDIVAALESFDAHACIVRALYLREHLTVAERHEMVRLIEQCVPVSLIAHDMPRAYLKAVLLADTFAHACAIEFGREPYGASEAMDGDIKDLSDRLRVMGMPVPSDSQDADALVRQLQSMST